VVNENGDFAAKPIAAAKLPRPTGALPVSTTKGMV
jgi:hypothetical protein